MAVQLRPHKVLDIQNNGAYTHGLMLTEGPHQGIQFSYTNVEFDDKTKPGELILRFDYHFHHIPENMRYNVKDFEQELGDFLVELLYYGLEKDHNLGCING